MKAKITKTSVDALRAQAKAEGKTVYCYDTDVAGFGCYATKAGSGSYFIEYRLGGRDSKNNRLTIGKHGVLTPNEARTLAKAKLGEVNSGKDVAQEKKDKRRKLASGTFTEVAEQYFALESDGTRYWRNKRALLARDVYPALGSKPITTITKAQIAAVIDTARRRTHAAGCNAFAAVRPLFRWAHERGIIDVNPMAAMRGPDPLKARERVLTDAEIKAFWQAAAEQSWPFENVFKLLLLTGQRREEVAGARWREFDLDAGIWTIAKERTKNKRTHRLDLSPEAVRLLDPIGESAAPRLAGTTDDLVFSTTGTTGVSGFSKVKKRLDAGMKELLGGKLEPWRTHDLRRTAASGMAALGFRPEVVERVLNHVSGTQGGLMGIYQRHDYAAERKAALLAWSDHVAALVGEGEAGSNVVRLHG